MSDPGPLAEHFTRLVYPFVVVTAGEASWAAPPHGWLQSLDLEHAEVVIPKRSKAKTASSGPMEDARMTLWEALPETEQRKLGERLIPTAREYLEGRSGDGPHLRGFRWCDQAQALLGAKLAVERKDTDRPTRVLFDLSAVELYLFDTAVGFVVLEVRAKGTVGVDDESASPSGSGPLPVDVLVEMNYRLRQMQRSAPEIVRWTGRKPQAAEAAAGAAGEQAGGREAPSDESLPHRVRSGKPFFIEEVINWSLAPLATERLETKPMASPYLLGLTFARLAPADASDGGGDPSPPDLASLGPTFFRLRRMYNRNYTPAPVDVSYEDNREVIRTFERVCIGICAEGVAVIDVDDGRTSFLRQLGDRVRSGYFALFLLALHQRVVLELLSLRTAQLRPLAAESEPPGPEFVKRVHLLRLQAFDVTLLHSFPSVSLTTMYQQVYERLLEALCVGPLHQALRDGLEEMDDLLQRKQRVEEQRRIEEEQRIRARELAIREEREVEERRRFAEEQRAREEREREEQRRFEAEQRAREERERLERRRFEAEQRAQEERERAEDKAKRALEVTIALLAPLALWLALWGVNWKEVVGSDQGAHALLSVWPLATLGITVIVSLCFFLWFEHNRTKPGQ